MNLKEQIMALKRNSIDITINSLSKNRTHFGGCPDVPKDFEWPRYDAKPLSFIAQVDCSILKGMDVENQLPEHGLLSFFYEMESQCWGFDPKDKGCARVYWFEDVSELTPMDFPFDLKAENRFPSLHIDLKQQDSYPVWEDFVEIYDMDDFDGYDRVRDSLMEVDDVQSKLLGWPDIIQGSMVTECDFASQGYYVGDGWKNIPQEVKDKAKESAIERWLLLFQLDTVEYEDFELMFGDCGRLYFFIQKEDLLARRFDKIWIQLQCC